MTQETINKYFQGELGQQCNSLFSTSDDRVFIRYHEAVSHSQENNLDIKLIQEWFEEYSGSDPVPIVRSQETHPTTIYGVEIEPEVMSAMDFLEEKTQSEGLEKAEAMACKKYGEDLTRAAIITIMKAGKWKEDLIEKSKTEPPIF